MTRILFPAPGDEIKITLYDGTGYLELQGYPEGVSAPDVPSESSSPDDDKLNDLSLIPVNAFEHGPEDFATPAASNVSYTLEELRTWDLLSEPSDPYEPVGSPEQLIQPLPVFNPPALDPQVPIPVLHVGLEEDLAVNTPTPPSGNLCNGKCNGNLLGPHRCQRLLGKLKITCLDNILCEGVFKTKNDFNRHCRTKHGLRNMQLVDCEFAGCNRVGNEGFTRRDNMRQHMRNAHGAACPVRQFQVRGPVHDYV